MKKRSHLLIRNRRQFFVGVISCLMLFSMVTQSRQIADEPDIAMTYVFTAPTIETVDIAGTHYDRVILPDCYPAGNAGEPKLPSKGVFLLIPAMSKINRIEIVPGAPSVLGLDHYVEPTSQAIPITSTGDLPVPVPNEMIYQSNAAYPGTLYTQVGIHHLRGYQILILLLHPVQYNPVTSELIYYNNLDVIVDTQETGTQSDFYRGFDQDRREVIQKVDNPWVTHTYHQQYRSVPTSVDTCDLLIITTDALKGSFEPLKQAHNATGVSTVVKTLTDIGGSNLESIRNYIRDAYTNWGIEYVLIGGDNNVIPAPMLWVSGMDENVSYYETTMPADHYYACLDGPYNYDGDGKWGEPHDGENGNDVDLIAEVFVGRACVGSTAEVDNFVTKTVTYINKDINNGYLKKTSFVGEYLGDYGIASYGGTYMDQLINGSTANGYTTLGIPTSDYIIDKLYDAPGYDWPPSEIISRINNGVHLINHLGHASYTYNFKLDNADVDNLNNPSNRTCFIYSQGCMAGGYDNGDCIAEHFTIKTTHAAFAGVWNARYGFFWSFSTDGDSQRLHRQFWDAVFGEGKPEIGRANHDSKEDNLPIIGRSCIRWCYYETNLFGDPTLQIADTGNHPPEKPDTPSGPIEGIISINYTFTTSSTDPDPGDLLYYQWNWDDGVSDWLGPYSSGQSVQTAHKWIAPGDYQIKVKAKDTTGEESDWSDPLIIHIATGPQIEIGMLSGGLRIKAEIKNLGLTNATQINWAITLQGFVLFGQEKSGTIPIINPDDSVTISTGLVFGLGPVKILVSAGEAEKTADTFLLGPFIINVR